MDLGQKIRALRKQAGFSLAELSQKSGLALGTLSRIENGKAGANVNTHMRLSEALGIPLAELYREVPLLDGEGRPLAPTSDDVETFVYDERASAILLARQVMQKNMLPQLIVLQPRGKTHREQHRPGSEKWLFVLEGEIEVTVGEQRHRLKRYGTLYFKASIPHQLTNQGGSPAKCISVTSPVGL